jgi:Tol biopolymer transport system component
MKIKSKIIFLLLLVAGLTNSVNAQFGKNKVQYRKFDWKYIQTIHFDIYFYDNATQLANLCAIQAEKSLASIENLLNYKMEKRVPIIIYNSKNEFQQTNLIGQYMPEGIGGVTELYKNRVVIPYLGDLKQFEHVIHHELVHAVLNNMFMGGTFQTAVSTNSVREIPIWMNEGLAEFESIGGLDTPTDMFMRDLTISEKLMDLDKISGYFAYRAGQAFYWYIAKKYGKKRVGELVNKFKIIPRLDQAFKSTFNKDLESFSEEWKKALKRFYLPDIAIYKNPDEFAIRLTNAKKNHTYYNSSPSISPKGDKFAFISARDGLYGIYIQDMNDKDNVEKLVSSLREQDFEELNVLTPGISWNPAGTKLAISAKSGGEDAIFIVDVDDGDYDRIRLGIASITSVTWSPDGNKLAFIGSGPKGSDIYIYDFRTKHHEKITDDIFSDHYPVWSWDSRQIYFLSDRENFVNLGDIPDSIKIWDIKLPELDIFRYDLRTKTIERITNEPEYKKTSLVVSPDNSKILFLSDKNGILNIYELDLNTGKEQPLTNSMNAISQLSITPDGNDLLFASQVELGFDIYQIRDPFGVRLDVDTLINTKFRQSLIKKQVLTEKLAVMSDSVANGSKKKQFKGYGNFSLEFSRQKVIGPNPDAVKTYNDGLVQTNYNNDTNFISKDYQVSFSPDVVLGNPNFSTFYGFQGSFQMMFSDLMGNHRIYLAANLWLDLKNSNLYASYSYLGNIINYDFAVFHNSIMTYGNSDFLFRFRNYGVSLKASYPFDLFRRLEWGVIFINLTRENVSIPTDPSLDRLLFVPNVKYIYDDVLWGFMAPSKGTRYYIDAKASPKVTANGLAFVKLDFDFREYVPIVSHYLTFVFRGAGGTSVGPNPQRSFLGGTENWINAEFAGGRLPFEQPEDFVFEQIIMPLRGFPVNALRGHHYFLSNVELRFPILAALATGPLPVMLQGLSGAGFMDIGGAWYGEYSSFQSTLTLPDGQVVPKDLRMSLGVGIRSILLGLPFKLDIAWRNEIGSWSQPYYMFSLGYDF